MKPYVEEFLYRGRCPDCEPGAEAAYHVVLAQFTTGPDGKQQQLHTQALTPEQATEAGFPLERILGEMATKAVLERDAAITRATKAEVERDVAKADYTAMGAALVKADQARATANRVAADALARTEALSEDYGVLLKQYDEAIAAKAPTGPSNPLLHALTGGLAGK